jgi:glycosyltransferase involved in cell wall biosynthesis
MKNKEPLITIAIPVKNKASCIRLVLHSLYNQLYPKNRIQLIFVDGFSSDGTYEEILNWVMQHKNEYFEIITLRDEGNIPIARNLCLRYSKGDYVLFWDADVIAPSMSITTLLNHFRESSIGIVNLPYDVENPNFIESVLKLEEPTKVSIVKAVPMGYTMVRKDLIKIVGYFNEKLEGFEDFEFCNRVRKAGFKIIMDPSIRLRHVKKAMSLSFFIKDNFLRRSRYIFMLIKIGSKLHFIRVLYYSMLPLIFLISGLLIFFYWTIGVKLLFLALIYLFLTVLWHARKVRRNFLYGLLSPLIYIIGGIALAYGVLWHYLKEKLSKFSIKMHKL